MEPTQPVLSDLEQNRLENIARNARYLTDLGIAPARASAKHRGSSSAGAAKRRLEHSNEDVRRSRRIATLKEVDYKKPPVPSASVGSDAAAPAVAAAEAEDQADIAEGTFKGIAPPISAPLSSAASSSSSSSVLTAHLDGFLGEQLGQPAEVFGKAAVMQIANGGQTVPRFNKYCGVAEWTNALFLWVNLDGAAYANTFSQRGKQVMWFGGSRMAAESRLVQRLYAAGVGAGAGGGDEVLLFVRTDGQPYTCLGRLKCVAADLAAQPIAIKWELLDHERLLLGQGQGSALFKEIAEAAA